MRQAVGGAVQAEIFYCAMQRVGGQCAVDAFSFELLRADLGAQVDGEASRAAMLIERAGAYAGASKAKHHRTAIVAGCGKELALETLHAHRAFAPCFARALGRKSADRAGQLAHQGFAGTRHQREAAGAGPGSRVPRLRPASCARAAKTILACRMRSVSADVREATARRPRIVTRGRVYEPGDHFAQAQPPKASNAGRRVARPAVPNRMRRH